MFKADRKLAILTKIEVLRERKASYKEIAVYLNEHNEYTLRDDTEWTHINVYNFYQRNKK